MIVVTVQEDGQILIPESVREQLGICVGTRLAVEAGDGDDGIHLRVVPEEAQLVEKDGVWVIRSQYSQPEESAVDWVARVREERMASLLGEQ